MAAVCDRLEGNDGRGFVELIFKIGLTDAAVAVLDDDGLCAFASSETMTSPAVSSVKPTDAPPSAVMTMSPLYQPFSLGEGTEA